MGSNIFNERQRFNQVWFWVLLIGGTLMSAILVQNFWVSLLMASIILFVYSNHLKTNIDKDNINYQFFPFHLKPRSIKWEDIKEAHVREYKPILEYGGWGLRYGRNGTAYNVKGNMGLQLKLNNGKKILIGTQKSEELEQFLQTVVSSQ